MQIIPMRELKNTVFIEKRCREANEPVFFFFFGYGSLVVMDIDYYERTMQRIYEAKVLKDGLEDLSSCALVDGPEVLGSIRDKYGI